MTSTLIGFFIFWGIWLLVPLLIDGTTAVAYILGAWRSERGYRRRREAYRLTEFPTVAIIVPVYNGQAYLAQCLESIRRQKYPQDRIDVIVVDNMSTDQTRQVFQEVKERPFEGTMDIISLPYRGKAWALNAGIHKSNADIICNVDSDTILKDDAIYNMVRAFVVHEDLAAATGTIEVLPVDSQGVHPLRYLLAEAEFVEYYVGFRIGRQFQSITNSLFTLAGAFSAFRREVLLQTSLYNDMTVSEDTDLTFEIHEKFPHMRIMAIPEAVAYVEPSPSLGALYAQRVRWQRGELEVISLHPRFLRNPFAIRGVRTPKTLIIDHTLAFPRVVWTFLFPLMYFMGYPLTLVVSATLSMYLVYIGLDALYMGVAYIMGDEEARRRLRRNWWIVAFLPGFRFAVFWFRFGGFLEVLMEPPQWRVRNPLVQTMDGLFQLRAGLMAALTQMYQSRVVSTLLQILRGG